MIREANIGDTNSIAKIIVRAWQCAYMGIIAPDYPKSLKEETFISIMNNNINNKLEDIFVYEQNKEIKGFISGKQIQGKYECEVVGLYVLPNYQGNGIGTALLNKMKNFYKNTNYRNMVIWTLKNAKNNVFYQKQGGIAAEEKLIDIGNRKYQGIGFVFQL